MSDLDFYCWREYADDDNDSRFKIPWSNPELRDFATVKEAQEFKDQVQGACILDEADILAGRDDDCSTHEHEDWDTSGWVLMHFVGRIVPSFDDMLSPMEDALAHALSLSGPDQARVGIDLFGKVDRLVEQEDLTDKQFRRLHAIRGTLLQRLFRLDGEPCDECGAFITARRDVQNLDHSRSCSLHPDNEVKD